MRPSIAISSDYASLVTPNADFYYGYERTDENEDWCFVAHVNGAEIVIPSTKLGVSDKFDVVTCLYMGIGWVMCKYKLASI
jgi:hypothetical protein